MKKIRLLDLTLPTPEENLALDEALLIELEQNPSADEILRLWESPDTFVVLGRSSKIDSEVNGGYCREQSIPILRRCSGGGVVVAGLGCLMYAIVLRYEGREHLRMLDQAHSHVMSRVQKAIQFAGVECSVEGVCDLAVNGRKVGGNAVRCSRDAILYHGTILYRMSGQLIEQCLGNPARQPAWRKQRGHADFVRSVPLSRQQLSAALASVWEVEQEPVVISPSVRESVNRLVAEKYCQRNWNELGQRAVFKQPVR